jgi:hypothetical protein
VLGRFDARWSDGAPVDITTKKPSVSRYMSCSPQASELRTRQHTSDSGWFPSCHDVPPSALSGSVGCPKNQSQSNKRGILRPKTSNIAGYCKTSLRQCATAFACVCIIGGCAHQPEDYVNSPLSNAGHLPESDVAVQIASLSNCTHSDDRELHLNSQEPVTVIVHGCFSSAGRFRSLADVFAFHGQQTVCFNYDDRDSLTNSSKELITALEELSAVLQKPEINIIGHSQGGLVARRALIEERSDRFSIDDINFDLVTISTPFGGIEAAAHCGSRTLAWLSIGLTKPLCQIITGRKYREIHGKSEFILEPGQLNSSVNEHLKIVTDEVDSCRVYDDQGDCVKDDFVFSIDEQHQGIVDSQTGLSSIIVKAGHVEIVGDASSVPTKLISILQEQRYLRATPADDKEALARLLVNLYLRSRLNGIINARSD